MEKIILASASPRRKEIFELLSLDFEIMVSQNEPPIEDGANVKEAVLLSAKAKSQDIFEKNQDRIVVGADTVVVIDNIALGKPKNEQDAKNTLKKLSGRKHQVMTAVYVCSPDFCDGFVATTEVEFYSLSDKEIDEYVKCGECMDKAGSYAVQGRGLRFVKAICGDYYNVVGFPAAEFVRWFEEKCK